MRRDRPFELKRRPLYATRDRDPISFDEGFERRTSALPGGWLFLLLGIGLVIVGCLVVFSTENPASEFVSQKVTSARYRLLAFFPQAGHDALLPTPNAPVSIPVFLDDDTTGPVTNSAGGTPQPTRVARLVTPTATRPAAAPAVNTQFIKASVALTGVRHDFQRWNNCGPTTLEMYLTYYGKSDSQTQVANFTKPNPDAKNVRPDELAAYANRAGLRTLIRVNGTVEQVKYLLSNGIPLIAETASSRVNCTSSTDSRMVTDRS